MLSKTDYIVLAVLKQKLGFKTTKQLYKFADEYMKKEFPQFPSYPQFNEGIKEPFRYFLVISWILTKNTRKKEAKYHIIDSSLLPVCNNQYRFLSRVFASAGKNLNEWFWGFKLHLIINHNMEVESIKISDGSTRDTEVLEGDFIEQISGWLVGDRSYVGIKKAQELSTKGIKLITKSRKNMKKYPALPIHNYLLSKRQKIESVFSHLKHRLLALNSYARSAEGFFVNVFASIVTYIFDKQAKETILIPTFFEQLIS